LGLMVHVLTGSMSLYRSEQSFFPITLLLMLVVLLVVVKVKLFKVLSFMITPLVLVLTV
jgi:hypothetical protein